MKKESPNVGMYVRVSTQDQSTLLQIQEIEKYVANRGWKIFRRYEDKSSGTNMNRPMLKELLTDARQRKLDVVICWKLDRLFRSLKDLIVTLQEFTDLGVALISLRDNIDLTTSSGRLMCQILGAFGEFEAALIKERVMAGLIAAKESGTKLGRPLKRDDNAIQRLRLQGRSIREIASALNVSTTAVQRGLAGVTKTPSS